MKNITIDTDFIFTRENFETEVVKTDMRNLEFHECESVIFGTVETYVRDLKSELLMNDFSLDEIESESASALLKKLKAKYKEQNIKLYYNVLENNVDIYFCLKNEDNVYREEEDEDDADCESLGCFYGTLLNDINEQLEFFSDDEPELDIFLEDLSIKEHVEKIYAYDDGPITDFSYNFKTLSKKEKHKMLVEAAECYGTRSVIYSLAELKDNFRYYS